MKLNLELEIHRSMGREDDRPMNVRISDDTSGCRILEVNFSLADFMDILTGRSGVSAEGEYYPDMPVGCTREHKEEVLPRPKGYDRNSKEVDRLIAPFEVDGWRGRKEDLHNHHRWTSDTKGVRGVRVTFSRFVRPDGTVWEPAK